MPRVMEPSAAIKRMRDATNAAERTVEDLSAKLNTLRAEHAKRLRQIESEYKRGYGDGYRQAVADVRERMGERK